MIVYDRLWQMMQQKGITQYALINKYHISPAQITRLKRNAGVSTHTIDVFCDILDCKVEDIMEYIPSSRISDDISGNNYLENTDTSDPVESVLLCAEDGIAYHR